MIIYKITNKVNNKVYIGQTIRPLLKRWRQHISYANNVTSNTHFARAIRKYGSGGFIIETIDTANTQEELDEKERYWIAYYNSTVSGYNEADGSVKCGGNTYKSKTKEELSIIKNKLSSTKLGKLNPASRKVRMIDTVDNTVKEFDTIRDCARFVGIKKGETSINVRLSGEVTSLYKKRYWFEYI